MRMNRALRNASKPRTFGNQTFFDVQRLWHVVVVIRYLKIKCYMRVILQLLLTLVQVLPCQIDGLDFSTSRSIRLIWLGNPTNKDTAYQKLGLSRLESLGPRCLYVCRQDPSGSKADPKDPKEQAEDSNQVLGSKVARTSPIVEVTRLLAWLVSSASMLAHGGTGISNGVMFWMTKGRSRQPFMDFFGFFWVIRGLSETDVDFHLRRCVGLGLLQVAQLG